MLDWYVRLANGAYSAGNPLFNDKVRGDADCFIMIYYVDCNAPEWRRGNSCVEADPSRGQEDQVVSTSV